MSKLKKTALACSIAFCLNYALYKLLHFTFFVSFVANIPWLEKGIAFFIGICAFIDILIFEKKD